MVWAAIDEDAPISSCGTAGRSTGAPPGVNCQEGPGDIGSGVMRRGAFEGVVCGTVVGAGGLGARARGGGGIPRPELCDPNYKKKKIKAGYRI